MPVRAIPEMQRVIADLSEPAAYPHPVANVQVIQTHISCVFLTGEYAYKVKKPVDFGFLDYRTANSRHEFCNKEIALNRRLSPDIYLDTVPITLQNGRMKIGGSGNVVEWAVKMRQLRAEDMLASRLEERSAEETEIRQIAGLLADFHVTAAETPAIRAWGTPAVIAGTITKTLDTMDALSMKLLAPETRKAIRHWMARFLDREKEVLRERMESGRVRDCHGDLRIQNVALDSRFDGGIQIFDCIEFNEEFRYIDVAADIAYLAMDLDLTGRADLREILVDSYTRTCGDRRLLSVLRFYQIYRACVRGNIALLAARETEIEDGQREAHRNTAAAAYDLARCYSREPAKPALFITVGFSGSGKSLLARESSRRLPAVLLSSDRVRKEAAGAAEADSLPSTFYTSAQRAAVYAELYRRAGVYLTRGENVILDATFLHSQEREAALQTAREVGTEFWILECQCPDAVIRQRLAARQKQANGSDADVAVYENQIRSYAPVVFAEGVKRNPRYLRINTDQPAHDGAHIVVDHFTYHS